MEEAWTSIPVFWQGVLSSITAALILIALTFALRISLSSVREWMRNRQIAIQAIREQLFASEANTRIEANLQIMVNVLKWLIFSGLFWLVPDLLYFLFRVDVLFIGRILVFVPIVMALRWIFLYQRPRRPISAELNQIVTTSLFRLFFNPPNRSKAITFRADGTVGAGQNNNENSWRIVDDKLEIIHLDGQVYSRFIYDFRKATFFHTNDQDTRSIKNQYIVMVQPLMIQSLGQGQ